MDSTPDQQDTSNTSNEWVRNLGHALLKKVEVTIGDTTYVNEGGNCTSTYHNQKNMYLDILSDIKNEQQQQDQPNSSIDISIDISTDISTDKHSPT